MHLALLHRISGRRSSAWQTPEARPGFAAERCDRDTSVHDQGRGPGAGATAARRMIEAVVSGIPVGAAIR